MNCRADLIEPDFKGIEMVAVVSGSGLGLFNSSASSLGGDNAGNAQVGRGRDRFYVNTTTGNLVVQSVDETLAALGLDYATVRTYNSQGLTDEDNGDQWRLGVHMRLSAVTGGTGVNTSGSRLTKTFGDGAEVVYTYNVARSRYESTDGDGADDFLTWNGSVWTWTDGSARTTEEYALVSGVQRVKFSRDTDLNTVTYNYTGSLLTSINMANPGAITNNAQTVTFTYDPTNTTNLRSIGVTSWNGTVLATQTLTSYTYDSLQRLQTVTVDLTPTNTSDSVTYTTTYAYDSTSKRIASITQSDGSSVAFTYLNVNGGYRLETVRDAENRVTTFTYNDVLTSGGSPGTGIANTTNLSNTEPLPYTRDSGALTTPAGGGWAADIIIDSLDTGIVESRVAYFNNGDGVAAWGQGSNIYLRRYIAATDTWQTPVTRNVGTAAVTMVKLAVDTVAGTAAVAWTQVNGGAVNLYACVMNASGTWTTAANVENLAGAVGTWSDDISVAVSGARAVVAYAQDNPTSRCVFIARYSGSAWVAAQVVDALPALAEYPTVAIDSSGNVGVVFRQSDGVASHSYYARWNQAAGTLSTPTLIDTHVDGSRFPQIAYDAQGNGFAVFRESGGLKVRRYTASNNQWSSATVLQTLTSDATNYRLAVDNAGNAIVGWVQNDAGGIKSMYANRYSVSGGTWSGAQPLETSSQPTSPDDYVAVAINGTTAAATWKHNNGVRYDVYVARFTGGSWQPAELLDIRDEQTSGLSVTVDATGRSLVGWTQADAAGGMSVHTRRYTSSGSGTPYYPIPSTGTTTWRMVANAVYHIDSDAAGTALQAALSPQTIVNGGQLTGFPPTLSVSTTVPWYVVVNTTNWAQLTQTVYGVQDVGLTQALQAATGLTTLTLNAHLPVPLSLPYTVGGGSSGPTIYQRTTVQDALGLVTTYLKDTQGRLVSVQTPAVGGTSIETRYTYDPVTGNVATITVDPTGLNRVTTFTYDTNTGLLMSTRDSLGNTVSRTYNSFNQLETQTSYTGRSTSTTPSGAMVSRFVYDGTTSSESHLRFAISADGRVTEHVYNANGERTTTYKYAANTYTGTYTEAALNTWATGQRGNALELSAYTYDFRSNISTITTWAATNASGVGTGTASVTRFIYDQRGMLLTTVEARGEATATPTNDYVTNYTYDGLGRSRTITSWVSGTETARTIRSIGYDDANRSTVTTFANGLTKTELFNRSGDLTSVAMGPGTLGQTTYTYDADGRLRVTTGPADASGVSVKTYSFYDEAGRKIGFVDGDGSLTEFIYNRAHQVIKTVRYATRLGSTTLGSLSTGTWSTVAFSTLRTEANPTATQAANQIARAVYDASGVLVFSLEDMGGGTYAITKNEYDGAGRLTDTFRYVNTQVILASVGEVLPAGITATANTASDRRTRFFYNNDGQLTGTLDAEGFLKENVYDAAGRLVTQIGYFNASDSSRWAAGTLDTLRPGSSGSAALLDANRDIRVRFFYDAQSRKIGELDGSRYLNEFIYDVAGNVTQTVRYDDVNGNLMQTARTSDTRSDNAGTATFAALKAAATSAGAVTHATAYTYDGLGNVLTETNFENTQTAYTYDIAGNVIAVTRANGVSAEARTTRTRYDVMGRVTDELTAEGSVALAALPGGATQGDIDAVWSKYGVKYTYDNASRRTSATVRPTDSQTITTYFYYDNDGRLRFELDALGRVTENKYDAFGQLTERIVHWKSVPVSSPQGGLLTTALIGTLTGAESASVHERTTYSYSTRGQLLSTTTVGGATTGTTYNVFGDVDTSTVGGLAAISYTYDRRGLQKLTKRGSVTLEDRTFDAFGRLTTLVDRGNTKSVTYDRLGREITSFESGDTGSRQITYDGFSRTTKVTDKLGNQTTYAYNDSARNVTVMTQEGIVVSTVHNLHGETLSVTANGNTTNYFYDRNGALTSASDNLGSLEGRAYDRTGRQISATDARGTITTFSYDAGNRMLTRVVDSGGLALSTTYAYDVNLRTMTVTEPGNRVTRTEYDRDGRVFAVIADATGSKPFRTEYLYDAANNTVRVTEGVGAATETKVRRTLYVYDTAGRRTHEYVDPVSLSGTLDLHTEYRYDDKDNLVRTIDANGNSKWFVYDAQRRLQQTVDALGGVTQNSYDSEDQVIGTRRFATSVTTSGFGDAIALQSTGQGLNIAAGDHVKRTVFDRDGRAKYTLETLATTGTPGNLTEQAVVTERTFDAAGNVTRTRMYKNAIDVPALWTTQNVATAITAAGNSATNVHADDRVERMVYDLRGRLEIKIDGAGAVTKYEYDANGNVTKTTQYAAIAPLDGAMRVFYVAGSNSSAAWTLGSFAAGDVVTATVRFKTAANNAGTVFLGDAGGPDPYDNYTQNSVVGNGGWQTVTVTQTMSHADLVWVYVYGGDAAGESVLYDNVTVSSVQRGTVLSDTFESLSANWGINGAAQAEVDPLTDFGTDALIRTFVNGLATPGQDRVTRFWYDRLDRQRFMLDAEGYLSETRYTDGSRIEETYRYFNPPTVAANATTADVAGAITTNALDRYERSEFNTAGRLAVRVDALGQQESFVYDAVGNKIQYTNKKNSVWNYVYDANQRLTEERSPSVAITTVSEPSADGGTLTSSTASAEIVTRLEYDALGNVKKRIEAYGRTEQRETQYEYDQLGRQKKVSTPNVLVYTPSGNELTGTRQEGTAVTLVSTTAYDVFGNAVLGQNAAGSYGHKAYDQLGRLIYDVDAELNVTSYQYDSFGNVTKLTRHINKVSLTAPTTLAESATWSASDISGHLTTNSSSDRFIVTEYDRLNRAKRVLQPAAFNFHPTPGASPGGTTSSVGAETQNRYNAFGEVILQRQLFASPATWSDTYFYYDRVGQRTATIDPLGYFSRDTYDAVGNVTRHLETAKPLVSGNWNEFSYRNVVETTSTLNPDDAAGYDRDFRYVYDRLDRKTEARQLHVEATTISGQLTPRSFVEQVTNYAYDAVGNQVRVRDHNGAETYTYYDVLGRVIAVAEPLRDIDGSGAITDITALTPLTLMRRNAHGDLVEEYRYALGASSATLAGYTAAGTHANDRSARILVDAFGRIRRTQDGINANQFASYDKLGKVTKEWQPVVNVDGVTETLVTLHRYDKLGREITIIEPQKVGTGAVTIYTQTRYNAFGEISAKGTNSSQIADGSPLAEYYEYDNAGRLWKTNSKGGADTVIFYDLMGNSTAEIRSLATNLRTYSLAQIADVYNLSLSNAMRTETVYDKRGGVVEQRQPTFESTTGVDPITATFTIGWVEGPANPQAIYQRQLVDYGEGAGLQEYFVANPTATLAQGGGWYLTAAGGYAQDPNHRIVTSLRITWAAPSESGVEATFQYRPWGSTNEGDFAGAPVALLGNDKLGVDVVGLVNQQYEYRVRYRRTSQVAHFAEAKGKFLLNGTTTAILGVVPKTPDPANEVATLPSVNANGIISWAAPSGSLVGLTPQFQLFLAGNWIDITTTLSGATYSVDVHTELATPGTYNYQIFYRRDGEVTAQKSGQIYSQGAGSNRTVTLTSHTPDTYAIFSEAISTITAQNTGQVGGQITGHQTWRGVTLGWSGTNKVQANWANAGTGAIKVVLKYTSGTWEVRVGSQGEIQQRGPKADIVREFFFASGTTSGELTFPNDGLAGDITLIQNLQVWRETSPGSGTYSIVYDQPNPGPSYGRSVTWTPPQSWSWNTTFEIAPQGTSNYTPLTVLNASSPWGVDLNGVAPNTYTYRVRYSTGNRVVAEQTGTLTIGVGGVSASLSTNQVFQATRITATASEDLLSWNYPPDAAPTSVVLTYTYSNYTTGGGSITKTPTSGSSYSHRFSDVTNAGPTKITYTIRYLHAGETSGYVEASGVMWITVANQSTPATVEVRTQNPVYPSGVQNIPDVTSVSNRYVNWTPPASAGATVKFQYRIPNTSGWTEVPYTPVSGGYRVDTAGISNGTYEYEILYTASGASNPYARGRGSFNVNRVSDVPSWTFEPTPASGAAPVQQTPRQLQTLDRWGNVIAATDTANNRTNYRYTVLGGVAQVTQPQVEIVSTAGGNAVVTPPSAASAPKLYNYFNALGQLVGTRDANGNVNSLWVNAAGQNIRENHADGGSKILVYNAFGNVSVTYDELLWATFYTYNRANRLTQITQDVASGISITKQFFYDEAGRRIRETTGDTSSVSDGDGGVESIRYLYDLAGNLTQRRTELGFTTNYGYDVQGRKTSEIDAISGSMSWSYDDFFLRTHTNLSGVIYTYNYNLAGLQSTQTGGGTNITNTYDWAGHLVTINDTAVGRVASYTYDFAARRTREKTTIGTLTHQDTLIGYDTLGRISTLTDLRYDLKYRYDAQGNRTHISATYYDHQQAPKTQNLWYTYDSMNRVLVSQGVNQFGVVTIDSTGGVRLTYDLAGRRKTATQWGNGFIRHETRDHQQGTEITTSDKYLLQTKNYTDTYSYDGAGRLTVIKRSGEEYVFTLPNNQSTTAADFVISDRTYDGASRLKLQKDWAVEGIRLRKRTSETWYDDDGRMTNQTNTKEITALYQPTVTKTETTISYNIDGAGVMRGYSVNVWDAEDGHTNAIRYTSNYVNSYLRADAYLDNGQSVTSTGSGKPEDGATQRAYNVNNEMTAFVDTRDHRKNRYFANNSAGQAMTVIQPITTETGATPDLSTAFQNAVQRRDNSTRSQHFFFAGGQAIGSFGQLIDESGQFKANFDVNYQPISAGNLASAPPTVIALTGDTPRAIAARFYGDANLWYVVADENGYTGPDYTIPEGTMVRMPNEVISLANNASTFKPFNPADALGDTTPTQPFPPPPKKGCGVIGQIIMIVIAAVVSAFVGPMVFALVQGALGVGAGATFAAGMLAATASGVAGSIVSQGIAVATDMQDSFSWKQVAAAGLTSALTFGLGAGLDKLGILAGNSVAQLAGRAAINNAVGQGVNISLKLQDKFDWKSVAASAVAAPIVHSVSKYLDGKFKGERSIGGTNVTGTEKVLGRIATNAINEGSKNLFVGGKFDTVSVIFDAFGSEIGNSLGDDFKTWYGERVEAREAETHSPGNSDGRFAAAADAYFPTLEEILARRGGVGNATQLGVPAPMMGDQLDPIANTDTSTDSSGGLPWLLDESPMDEIVVSATQCDYVSPLPLGGDGHRALRLTTRDLDALQTGLNLVEDSAVSRVFDETNPHQYLYFPVFEGTDNDRKQVWETNPSILEHLVDQGTNVTTRYYDGVGDSSFTNHFKHPSSWFTSGLGWGIKATIDLAYADLVEYANNVYREDPDANIVIVGTGFSRGAAALRSFFNLVNERGIPDTSSPMIYVNRGVRAYSRNLPSPTLGGELMFDSVASVLFPGTRFDGPNIDMRIPETLVNALQFRARDEKRMAFPFSSILNRSGSSGNPYWHEITVPGVHSDVGGNYANPYSRIILGSAYDYLGRLGVPLNPMCSYSPPKLSDPTLRIHDSGGWDTWVTWGRDVYRPGTSPSPLLKRRK